MSPATKYFNSYWNIYGHLPIQVGSETVDEMQIKEMKELIEEKVNELMEEAASNKTADMSVIEERKSFIF